MNQPPRQRVVIAGGGTAGWLAAVGLATHLGPLLDIHLVESDEIGTVGVGESTIPTARSFHQLCGIDEEAFVQATQATFKLGIVFEHWGRLGDRYFHPFGTVGRSVRMADFQHFWLEARNRGFGGDFLDHSLEATAALRERFAPDGALAYAYHLDATAYARFLRSHAERSGVTRIEGRIVAVERQPDGDIAALRLADGSGVEGDFFIDCTGFRALLIEEELATGFEDWSEWLAMDRAFAVQSEAVGAPVPYTRAIAHDAGWRWRIPLQQRVGNGLVFASEFLNDQTARDRLLGAIDGTPLFEPRLLQFKTGRRRLAWNRNCVALGLAAGFIEPLESTSIHLVMIAVTRLIQNFPFSKDRDALALRFNTQSRQEWEHVRDFIILHYKLTHRDDSPFWRRCAAMTVPDSLAERMALWREQATAYQDQDDLFRVDSWAAVMLGQGVLPKAHHRLAAIMADDALRGALDGLKAMIATELAKLPSHEATLARYRDGTAQA